MSDRLLNFNLNTREDARPPLLNEPGMALLKHLLQATTPSIPNYFPLTNDNTTQRSLLLQQQQAYQNCHPSFLQIPQQSLQQQHPVPIQPKQPQHAKQTAPILPHQSNTKEPNNTAHFNQTFTLRPASSSLVSFNASLRIAEIEDFGKHILQTCQTVDKYIYDALVLKETVVPTLEADNSSLKKDVDSLQRENEKLNAEKTFLIEQMNTLRLECNAEQANVLVLAKELESRDQHMVNLTRTLDSVSKKLKDKKEELETKVDDLEKLKLQIQHKDEKIGCLESSMRKTRGKLVSWKKAFKKHTYEIKKLKNSKEDLEEEVRSLKQSLRNREHELDNMKIEMDTAKFEAMDWVEEESKYKKECDYLKEYAAKLEAAVKQETEKRKKMEEIFPTLIKSSLESSIKNIVVHMDKRQSNSDERKRHAEPPVVKQVVGPSKKRAIKSVDQQQSGNKVKGKVLKRDKAQGKKEKDGREKKKRGTSCATGANKTYIPDHDDENAGDGHQKQGGSKVKIILPQWKLLPKSAASAAALTNAAAHDENKIPKKTSVSVSNRNNLVMKFKMTKK